MSVLVLQLNHDHMLQKEQYYKKYRRDINIQEIFSFVQMESHAVLMSEWKCILCSGMCSLLVSN